MKKALLAMLLVCALVLTGCSLVVKDPEVDARQVILNINGVTVDKQTMVGLYNGMLNQEYQMQQLYQMYGMQAPPIDYQKLLNDTRDMAIRRELIRQQAKAQGLDQLTEAEEQQLNEQVDTEWAANLDWVKANYLPDTTLEGDALTEELEHRAEDLGISRDVTREAVLEQFISDKLEKATTADITVTDEEVQVSFDQQVEQARTAYADNPDSYGSTVNSGGTVYYAPAGYRFIKQVLIKFLPEDQEVIDQLSAEQATVDAALTRAQNDLTVNEEALKAENLADDAAKTLLDAQPALKTAVDEAQAEVDRVANLLNGAKEKGYQNILPKAQEVVERAKTEDFDTLAAKFNEDKGIPATGYAVREGFATFDSAFVEPAMALKAVGDVSEPSPGVYGYYIVQYAAEIPEGPAALSTVRDGLHDTLLTEQTTAAWEAALATWREEGDIQEYMDRMSD